MSTRITVSGPQMEAYLKSTSVRAMLYEHAKDLKAALETEFIPAASNIKKTTFIDGGDAGDRARVRVGVTNMTYTDFGKKGFQMTIFRRAL